MARSKQRQAAGLVASVDLAAGLRTIGGILGQLHAAELERAVAVNILASAGLPAIAYDDPSFPISVRQDFELLNEIRKHLPAEVSTEVVHFLRVPFIRANMFGALGLAWQSAPTMLHCIEAVKAYPQANWGRSRMLLSASLTEERIDYVLDRERVPLGTPEEVDATHRYALLLDLTAGVAIALDVVSDRSLLKRIELPFPQPQDWSVVAGTLRCPVEFDAPTAAVVYRPGFMRHVPRRAHEPSFRLAMKLVGKESEVLSEDISLRDRVVRWLWASSPPLKKTEISKLIGMSERSLSRQLAGEGTSYNELFAEVQAERARNLLGNRKLKIAEVAYRMGYADPAAFTRAFTGWHGLTPSDWRLRE